MTVLLVDPVGELGPFSRTLHETDDTMTLETVSSTAELASTSVEPDCLVVLEHEEEGIDGAEQMHAAREHLRDVPIVVLAVDPRAYYAPGVLSAGAADVICVDSDIAAGIDRPVPTVRRIRHAAGMGESFQTDGELLHSVMKYLPHQVFIKDDVGRIAAISDVSVREHRASREQLIGMTDYDLFEPQTAADLRAQEEEIMAAGEPMINNVEHFTDEDGRDRWVNTTKAPRYDSEGDEVAGIIGTARDITDQKRNEKMMNGLHAASRKLVSAKSMERIVETAVEIAEEIPGLPMLDVLLSDASGGSLRPVATSRDGGRPSIYDRYTQWFDRAYETESLQFIVQLSVADRSAVVGYTESERADKTDPIAVVLPLGEHGVLGFESTSDPLDEFSIELMKVLAANVEAALDRVAREDAIRERERELERQNERLEEFASIVSHDLRNPLSVAQGYAEMFDEGDESGHQVQWALDRMERLTDELLALARQGQIVGNTETVSLRSLIERAWQSVDTGDAMLDVRADLAFEADPGRTAELFENLLKNSVEHGSTNSRSQTDDSVEHVSTSTADAVRITAGTVADGFYVEDDGPGIPDDRKPLVFDQGYSGEDGTGFGLYIVETLAEAHEWSVTGTDAEHAPSGARFEFTGVVPR
ncbi:PAS domain-containing protein [Natronoarchaeum sp. GCM10025703]|uniref:PAS domain-containing protein n=1 Tax=unclassified Natronoarchaeum TaxID=2620183 RepID=UPI00361952D7